MAHHGFVEPEDPQSGVRSHTPAVDSPFEWREEADSE
ncbi:hypothetical protein BJ982_000907 [Sphaerisporangium siamense]|uniref:Uncharacterized protein n=1 Tax=Sphaerisporangium siamense TaxID=795645 RepID=A0A7W7D5L3_9ACTN|nr:hypothetical protein [Sphaerisporangium siamense]